MGEEKKEKEKEEKEEKEEKNLHATNCKCGFQG